MTWLELIYIASHHVSIVSALVSFYKFSNFASSFYC